jgi:ATP/maltotriose-dependent transcriptional regulator MalT
MLAEALPDGATLVIDDLHQVEDRPPVLAVLRALTAAVAPGALVVLVSRRSIHAELSRAVLTGAAGSMPGGTLAFTSEEVGALLEAHDVDAEPAEVADASGGWAAGIVFDAVRGRRAAQGAADDPFFEYLGAEVLAPVAPDVRTAVIRSAVLEIVEPHALATLLDVPSADALYLEIRRHHLPATIEPEGLRYHPRFREFLLSLLDRDPAAKRALRARDARRLRDEGQAEEAADRFLQAGACDEAAACVEAAGRDLVARGDGEKADRWCSLLGEELLSRRPALRAGQLAAVMAGRRPDLPELAARLVASGEYARLAEETPDAAAHAAFGVHLTGDWRRAARMLPADATAPVVRATRYVLEVGSGDLPPRPWPLHQMPADRTEIGLVECGRYFQGHFDEIEEMRRDDEGVGARTSVYYISTLRERGRLGDARTWLELARSSATVSEWSEFWLHVEGELAFAEGDREGGLALVRDARAMARARGHQPADRAIFAATEGKMLVRLGRVDEAAERLRQAMAWSRERGLPCFWEQSATWLAAARLAQDEDPDVVSGLLRETIDGMDRADRRLEQPAAQVLLAEARWRAGDDDGHDEAAHRALEVSEWMGSFGPLVAVLADVPDVLSRCIDAGGPREADWRRLAHAGEASHASSTTEEARIVIGTLGRLRVAVDGAERDVNPSRAIDIAAEVARAGWRGVPRAELVELLSEHSVDAQNYLRQVVHRLRRIAPEGVELTSEDGMLRWTPAGAVVTEDDVLRALLAQVGRETGEMRLRTLAAALELAERGVLVTAADSVAASELRADLTAAVAEAQREFARMLLAAGRATEAVAAAREPATAEPLREDGWCLLMRASAAADGPAAVVPVYAECTAALAEIGLEPSSGTRDLLRRLRHPDGRRVSAPA